MNSFGAVVRLRSRAAFLPWAPPKEARRVVGARKTRQPRRSAANVLLDFDFSAGFFELLLDGRRFVLVNAFLDGLGRAVHQALGFLQAQAGAVGNGLDEFDLVADHVGENEGDLRLLSWRSRAGRFTAACSPN